MSKKVIVTGASGGFGSLTVKSLIMNGHKVVGTMRSTKGKNSEIADELRSAGAYLVEMDVIDDKSVKEASEKAIEMLGGLDVVVNNAGVGVIGMQEHFTAEDMKQLFEVNVFGVQRMNRAVLPLFRKNNEGLLIHVTSLLGRMTFPFYGPYNASKWALEAIAENYRSELSGFGIESCVVEPGGYPTTFFTNIMKPSDNSRDAEYGDFMNVPDQMFEGFGKALENNPEQKPQDVADAIVDLIEIPKGEKPFRTVVDKMGMGDHIKGYNEQAEQITNGIYSAFQMEGMLKVK